ncbi:hypothetical protein BGW38_003962, partial [Lunasporangiospora selenospora]
KHGQDAGHRVRSYGPAPRDSQTSIPTKTDPAQWDPALPEDPTIPEGLSYTSDNLPPIQHSLDHHPNTGVKGPPTLQAKGATTTTGKRSMHRKYHSLSRSPRAPPTDEYDDDCNNGDYKDNDHDSYNNIKDDNNSQSACLDLYPSTPSRSSNLCTIPCSTPASSPQPHRSPIPTAGASPPSRHSRHVSACYNLPPPPPRLLFEPESDSIAHATWPRSRRSGSFTRPQLGAAVVAHRHGTPGHSRTPSTGVNPDPTSYLMLPTSPRPPTAAITARTTTTAATTTAAVAMRTTLATTTVSSHRYLSASPPKTLTASSKKSRKYPSSPSPSATFSVPSSQEKESNASFSRICSILAHLLTDASSAVGADLEELQKSTWPPPASLLTSVSSSIASSALVSSASSSETEDNSCTVAATPENHRRRHSVRYHAELASAKTNDFFDNHKELYNGPGSGSGQEEDEEIRRQRQQLQQRSYGIVDAKLELWRERVQRQRRPALSRRQSLAEAAAEADASKRTSLYLELQNVEEKERQLQEPDTEYREDQDQYQNLEQNLNPWEAFQEATIRNGGFVPGGLLAMVNDPSKTGKGVQKWQDGDCDPVTGETDDHLPQPPTSPSTTESSQETWLRDWTQALREAAFPGHSGSRPIPIQTLSPSDSQFSLPRRCASFPLRRTDLVQLEQAEVFHQVMEQVDTELDRTVETIDGLTRDLVAVASQQTILQMKLQQSKRRFRRERQCRHSHQRQINMGIPMLNESLLGPALSPKKRKKYGFHKRSTSQIVLPSTLGQERLYDSSDEEDEGDEIFSEDEEELFEMDDMDELGLYGMDNHGESDYFLESEESEDEGDHFSRRESFGMPESTLLDHEHMDLVGLGSFAEGRLASEDEDDQDNDGAVNTFRFSDSSLTLTNRSCRNSATSTLVSLVARMEKEQGPDSATTTISSRLGQHEKQGQEGRILDRRMLKQLLEPVAEGQHDDTLGSLRLTEATVSRLLMELRYLDNEAGNEKDETEIESFSRKVLSGKKDHHPGVIQHVAEIFSHPGTNEFGRTLGLLGCGFEEEKKVKTVEAEVEKVVGKILVEDKTGHDFERDIALASPMTPLPTHVSLSVNRSREQDLGLDSDTSRGVETEPYLTPIPTGSSSSPSFNSTDRPLIRQMQMPTWPRSETLPLSGPSLGEVIVREQGRIPPELVYSAEAVILTMMDLLRMMYWGILFMVGALVVDEHLTSTAGQRVIEIIGRVQGVLLMPSKTKRLGGPGRPRSRNIGDGGSSVHSSESGRGSRMRHRPRRRQLYQGQRGQPAFAKEMDCDQWYGGVESDRMVPKAGTFGRRLSLVGTRARKQAQSRSRQTMFV